MLETAFSLKIWRIVFRFQCCYWEAWIDLGSWPIYCLVSVFFFWKFLEYSLCSHSFNISVWCTLCQYFALGTLGCWRLSLFRSETHAFSFWEDFLNVFFKFSSASLFSLSRIYFIWMLDFLDWDSTFIISFLLFAT